MIAEAARQARLTARAVRYYERIGLIAAPPRTRSNYRIYDERAVARLRFIARCRALGYTIGEIRSFGDDSMVKEGSRKGTSAEAREQLRLTEAKIRKLLQIRRELLQELGQRTAAEECGGRPVVAARVRRAS